MKRFEVGKRYEMRSACDHDCIWRYEVVDRTTSFHELLPMVKGHWDEALFSTKIPRAQDVVNAENAGTPVTYKYPRCKASKAYAKLIDEVVDRLEKD